MSLGVDSATTAIGLKGLATEKDDDNVLKAENVEDLNIANENVVGVDELSPNTMKEIKVVMQHYDNKTEVGVESAVVLHEPAHVISVVGDKVADEVVADAVKTAESEERVTNEIIANVAKTVEGEKRVSDMISSVVSEIKEVNATNADNVVLEVAREVAKFDLSSEKMDGLASAFKKKSIDDMKDAGVVIKNRLICIHYVLIFIVLKCLLCFCRLLQKLWCCETLPAKLM